MSKQSDSGATAISRRTALKTGATAATVAAVSFTAKVEPVNATESGEVELETAATIPDDSAIQVTVEEYEDENDEEPTNVATREIDDGRNTYDLSDLDGYDYSEFEIELGTDDERSELEELTLTIPLGTDDGGESDDDDIITIFGFEVPSLDDLWPFGDDGDDEDDGWFDFDFWPFNGDD